MIEIAVSLAIIGFALVAIIGVLPIGMNVQKVNREETIINQDETVLMDAIRNGQQGLDDLTNYVMAITNVAVLYDQTLTKVLNGPMTYWYTPSNSSVSPQFPLNNGFRIVGLLSTPKYQPWTPPKGAGGVLSNHVIAYVRSMSGPASEKYPQNNQTMQDLTFSYRMTSEVVDYGYSPNWPNPMVPNLQSNLHELRLTFLWPLLPKGQVGNGGQSFRTLVSGLLSQTNDIGYPLFFFQPRTYVKAP